MHLYCEHSHVSLRETYPRSISSYHADYPLRLAAHLMLAVVSTAGVAESAACYRFPTYHCQSGTERRFGKNACKLPLKLYIIYL